VTQGGSRASLSSIAKTSFGCKGNFGLVGTSERVPTWATGDVWSETTCKLSVESVWCIDRVFPCRVYIDSNRRDSQI
jgi:hypothetical protein